MLRNREFRQFAIGFFLITAVLAAFGFTVGRQAGVLVILAALSYGTLFFLFTRARYKSIAKIAEQIDRVLHNEDHLYIGEAEEGELSILRSEVTKMMLRIREQNEALKKEKTHLADSLADIAHQLRTPLTSANLILSLLGKHPDENQQKAFVREAELLLMRMDWLITALLKISRLDAGIVEFKQEQVNAESLIRTALRPLLIPMELHQMKVKMNAPEEIWIQGDFGWLTEAIQNILKNCMESAGENGRIEITLKDTLLYSEIEIHDSGKGFDKEELPRLFERFYRGKSQNMAGYGIGLALCKMIITRQGGTITAKNHPQGGAVFHIRFPK